MHKHIADKLIAALRSGNYTQIRGQLGKRMEVDGKRQDCHCVMGVLTELAIEDGIPIEKTYRADDACSDDTITYDGMFVSVPSAAETYGGFDFEKDNPLVRMNDGFFEADLTIPETKPHTFAELADWLELHYAEL